MKRRNITNKNQFNFPKFQSNDNVASSTVINSDLITIENDLSEYYEKGQLNALNLYMYGTVLK